MRKFVLLAVSVLAVYGPILGALALALVRSQRFAPWMAGVGAILVGVVFLISRGGRGLPSGTIQIVAYYVFTLSLLILVAGSIGLIVRTLRRSRPHITRGRR